jgi:hypothetical protein
MKKSLKLHHDAALLDAIESASKDTTKEEMKAKFDEALGAVSIHKIKVFLDANKHFMNKQGIHFHEPTLTADGSHEIVFTGKHKNGKIAAVRIELSDDDMKTMKDDEVYYLISKACVQIAEFKEGSGLQVGGLVV